MASSLTTTPTPPVAVRVSSEEANDSFFPPSKNGTWTASEGIVTTPPTKPHTSPVGLLTPTSAHSLPKRTTPSSRTGSQHSLHSCVSSDTYTEHSGRSGDSSDLLTPPLFQADSDNPPFIARPEDPNSLTMMEVRRASTLPDNKKLKRKSKKRNRIHKCKCHKDGHGRGIKAELWVPTREAAGATQDDSRIQPNLGGFKLEDPVHSIPVGLSRRNIPRLCRRWSHLEIGRLLEPATATATSYSGSSVIFGALSERSITPTGPSYIPNTKHKKRKFKAVHELEDMVHTVREKLTLREIPLETLHIPESITLRRASVVEEEIAPTPTSVPKFEVKAGDDNALERLQGLLHRRPSAVYLITNQDIQNITDMIENELRRKYERMNVSRSSHTGTTLSTSGSPSPQVTTTVGSVIPQNFPDLALSIEQAQAALPPATSPENHLKVDTGLEPIGPRPRTLSQRSVHELIWEDNVNDGITSFEGHDKQSYCSDCSNGPATPQDNMSGTERPSPVTSDAFDPNNAKASIGDWASKTTKNIAFVVTSSDSESPGNASPKYGGKAEGGKQQSVKSPSQAELHRRRRSKVVFQPRAAISDSNLHRKSREGSSVEDVVSFPPLPRKATDDWFSPLPEMITTPPNEVPPPLSNSRSLWDLGLDMNFGPNKFRAPSITPKASQYFGKPELAPPNRLALKPSIEFAPGFDMRKKSTVQRQPTLEAPLSHDTFTVLHGGGNRRKSMVKEPTLAVARTAELNVMGASIGSHSHERRKSAAYFAPRKRVKTLDNHKGEHGPPSKWRNPSVAPAWRPLSPDVEDRPDDEPEDEPKDRPEDGNPGSTAFTKVKTGLLDYITLLKEKVPTQPKVDPIGIYAQLTGARQGTVRTKNTSLSQDGPSRTHNCDDCAKDARNPSVDWIG